MTANSLVPIANPPVASANRTDLTVRGGSERAAGAAAGASAGMHVLCIATSPRTMKLRQRRCAGARLRPAPGRSPAVVRAAGTPRRRRGNTRASRLDRSPTREIAMPLRAFGLNCTLKAGPQPSSTQKLLDQVLQAL